MPVSFTVFGAGALPVADFEGVQGPAGPSGVGGEAGDAPSVVVGEVELGAGAWAF